MKQCAFLLCLMLFLGAAASAEELTESLIMENFVLADGEGVASFCLHADHTATFYDFADAEKKALVPRDLRGEWRLDGDMLTFRTGDEEQVFTCTYQPGESPYEDALYLDTDGKRTAYRQNWDIPVSAESRTPENVCASALVLHPGGTVTGVQLVRDTPDGHHLFLLMEENSVRYLMGYRLDEENTWHCFMDASNPVPQGDLPAFLGNLPRGMVYTRMSGLDALDAPTVSDGLNIIITTTNGESYMDRVQYSFRDGQYLLDEYTRDISTFAYVLEDKVVFSNIGDGYDGTLNASWERAMNKVVFAKLPHYRQAVERTAGGAPVFVFDETANGIRMCDAAFPKDQKFPVYRGPGEAYGRAANGKAAVSTNGWIQVLGKYQGYVLIQYGLDEHRFRIGWIEESCLPRDAQVHTLEWMDALVLQGEDLHITLTDDPLGQAAPVYTLDGDMEVYLMAELGSDWVLVRVVCDGQTYWGFVFSSVVAANG